MAVRLMHFWQRLYLLAKGYKRLVNLCKRFLQAHGASLGGIRHYCPRAACKIKVTPSWSAACTPLAWSRRLFPYQDQCDRS